MRLQRQRFTAHLSFAMPDFHFWDRSTDRRATACIDAADVAADVVSMGGMPAFLFNGRAV